MLPYLITDNSITVVNEGEIKIFTAGTADYEKVLEFIKNDDQEGLIDTLFALKKSIESQYDGFSVRDNIVFVKNNDGTESELPRTLGTRLKSFAEQGLPYFPILRFYERLKNNPSYDSVNRLFVCLEANNHPICADGRFLAWRKVRRDGKKLVDIYTGKVDNSVGQKPRMNRNEVDDNHNVTCSRGYHGASFSYAKYDYGNANDVMIEIAVDPADVVSVPVDYDNKKMRICGYEVLREVEVENTKPLADPENLDLEKEEDDCCEDCGDDFDHCECSEDDELCDCGEYLDDCECNW